MDLGASAAGRDFGDVSQILDVRCSWSSFGHDGQLPARVRSTVPMILRTNCGPMGRGSKHEDSVAKRNVCPTCTASEIVSSPMPI